MAEIHPFNAATPPHALTDADFQSDPTASETPRYAVIFRTHFWDEFVSRQFRHLQDQVKSGNVYVLVDETRGPVEIPDTTLVFRLTDQQVLDAGYVRAGEGSIQWYSGDVPLYLFRESHPDYAYYIQLEYDVNVTIDLDSLVCKAAFEGVELIASSRNEDPLGWYWLNTCLDVYKREDVIFRLICLSVFSGSALDGLAAARREQAEWFLAGRISLWPMCEGFLATEASKQKLNIRELSTYGDIANYDFWPPYSERDLGRMPPNSFMHPVLDNKRYVPSLLKYYPGLVAMLSPIGWLHRKLRRLGPVEYGRALFSAPFRHALDFAVRRRLSMNAAPKPSG